MKPPYWVRYESEGSHGRGRILYFEVCGPNDFSIKYYTRSSSVNAEMEAHTEAHAHCNRLNASYQSGRTYTIAELIGEEGKRP